MKRALLVLMAGLLVVATMAVTASMAFAVPREPTNPGGQQPPGKRNTRAKRVICKGTLLARSPSRAARASRLVQEGTNESPRRTKGAERKDSAPFRKRRERG